MAKGCGTATTKKGLAELIIKKCHDKEVGCYILRGLMHHDVYDEHYDDKEILIEELCLLPYKQLATAWKHIEKVAFTLPRF